MPALKLSDWSEVLVPGSVPQRYCCYHQSYTHTIEECAQLKREIEALIQKGAPPSPNQLRIWLPLQNEGVDRPTTSSWDKGKQPTFEEEEVNWKHKSFINVIIGGPERGDSSGSRKACGLVSFMLEPSTMEMRKVSREPIILTDDDLSRGQVPHWDALVKAMDVNETIAHWWIWVVVLTSSTWRLSRSWVYAVIVSSWFRLPWQGSLGIPLSRKSLSSCRLSLEPTRVRERWIWSSSWQTWHVPTI